jgi:hypothetical protein
LAVDCFNNTSATYGFPLIKVVYTGSKKTNGICVRPYTAALKTPYPTIRTSTFNLGRQVILPSSYIGGPRYMNLRFQDAMALARHYHGFDLFVTMTCNPTWPEIANELLAGQTTADRPDLVVRVFQLYKTKLLEELAQSSILGVIQAHVHTYNRVSKTRSPTHASPSQSTTSLSTTHCCTS